MPDYLCVKVEDQMSNKHYQNHTIRKNAGFLHASIPFPILPSVEAAVAAFSQSRPPGIYKGDYLKELFRRYGDLEDAPPAPELPDWCFDDEDGNGDVDDDGNAIGQDSGPSSSGSAPGKRKKERLHLVSERGP